MEYYTKEDEEYFASLMQGYISVPDDDEESYSGWGVQGGELHPMYGQTHTEQSKKLMRQADKSHTKTKEFSDTMSKSTQNVWDSGKRQRIDRIASNKYHYRRGVKTNTPKDWHSSGPGR